MARKAIRATKIEGPKSEPRAFTRPGGHLSERLTEAGLVGIDVSGRPLVDWGLGERPAEILAACSDTELVAAIRARRRVAIDFLDGDPERPVILGLLRSRLGGDDADDASRSSERFIDIASTQGIVLRCGESAIELHPNGRVVIRGVDVVSIADGTNKVLGATVAIN